MLAALPRRRTLACALLGMLAGCKDRPPDGVRDVDITDPGGYYAREGFVRLEPPVHLPTSAPAIDQVEIWIRLPPQGSIDLHGEGDAARLAFPPQTVIDRVEFFDTGAARRIVDIRGTTIRADGGQDYHAYRPAGTTPEAPLVGVQWSRDDAAVQEPATARLLERIAAVPPVRDFPEPRRRRVLQDVRAKNRCASCHVASRADNATLGEHGLVNRGTDASGLFTPQTVLRDVGVLETYGRDDRSTSDPALALSCAQRAASADEIAARRCPDDEAMRGRLDWDVLWREDPVRAQRICDGRAALVARMSPAARDQFAIALKPCEKPHRKGTSGP